LKASMELLQLCFPDAAQVSEALEELQRKSVITYRKFSGEFRIWEGSDFDLEAEVVEVM